MLEVAEDDELEARQLDLPPIHINMVVVAFTAVCIIQGMRLFILKKKNVS